MNVQNNSPLIFLTSYSDRLQADLVISMLRGRGINTEIQSDDAGGLYSSLTVAAGVKIFVPEHQLEDALSLLDG